LIGIVQAQFSEQEKKMIPAFSAKQIGRDGSILSLIFGVSVFGMMAYEPEIWVHDYPPDIRQKWGEKSPRAKKLTKLLGVPFLVIFFGGLVYSACQLRRANGGRLSFGTAFVHAYALYMFINLFDLLVLDWLIFMKVRPQFAILPGTEGMAGYNDYLFHAKASAKGSILGIVIALVVALLTTSWGK
jgi:hypothetical protein